MNAFISSCSVHYNNLKEKGVPAINREIVWIYEIFLHIYYNANSISSQEAPHYFGIPNCLHYSTQNYTNPERYQIVLQSANIVLNETDDRQPLLALTMPQKVHLH